MVKHHHLVHCREAHISCSTYSVPIGNTDHQFLHQSLGHKIPHTGRIWGACVSCTCGILSGTAAGILHRYIHTKYTQLQAVQFELLNTAILQLSREGFRRTALRSGKVCISVMMTSVVQHTPPVWKKKKQLLLMCIVSHRQQRHRYCRLLRLYWPLV